MIIGITGGTGCGKTTLLNLIRQRGGLVLDCDAIYHELLKTDEAMLRAIDDRFPGVVEDGQLLRKKLGALVFADRTALEDLNRITHAAVIQEVEKMLPGHQHCAIDAIALFESGMDAFGYSLSVMWIVLPVMFFAVSFVIGFRDYFGKWKWLAALGFSLMYTLSGYTTSIAVDDVMYQSVMWPDFTKLPIGLFISLAGLLLGVMLRRRKYDQN
jgi:hypothetical protein